MLFLAKENGEVLSAWLLGLLFFFFKRSCVCKARAVCRNTAINKFQNQNALIFFLSPPLPCFLMEASMTGSLNASGKYKKEK